MAEPNADHGQPAPMRPRAWSQPWRNMAALMAGAQDAEPEHSPHVRAARVIDCAVYVDGMRTPGRPSYAEAHENTAQTPGAFMWLGLHEPTLEQMADVANVFGLDQFAVDDAVTADVRPKIAHYGETTFFVLRTARYVEHPELTETSEIVETGVIMIFVGERFVITVRHGAHGELGPIRADLEKEPQRLAQGPWAVAHAICDRIVDNYLDVSTAVEVDLDTLEERVFAPDANSRIAQIYHLKSELMQFKRAVAPLQRPLTELIDDKTLFPKEIRRYFRDVNEHLLRVTERIAAFDDLISSVLQARLAQVTVDQNNDMRKIAAWAAIAAVQTAIAGIYGMNFTFMPELLTRYGYPTVLAVMLLSAIVLYRMFRRSGWL